MFTLETKSNIVSSLLWGDGLAKNCSEYINFITKECTKAVSDPKLVVLMVGYLRGTAFSSGVFLNMLASIPESPLSGALAYLPPAYVFYNFVTKRKTKTIPWRVWMVELPAWVTARVRLSKREFGTRSRDSSWAIMPPIDIPTTWTDCHCRWLMRPNASYAIIDVLKIKIKAKWDAKSLQKVVMKPF